MNGATAEPCVKTNNDPNNNKIINIGAIQNFLRTFINSHKSFIKSNTKMGSPYCLFLVYYEPVYKWTYFCQISLKVNPYRIVL